MTQSKSVMPKRDIILLSLLFSGMMFIITLYIRNIEGNARDWSWIFNGASVLLKGENPYSHTDLGMPADVLLYPMPAILVAFPLVWLPETIAAAIFMAISCGILAYVILSHTPQHTWIIFSSSFWGCIYYNQWSILLAAFILIPAARPIAIAIKPTFIFVALSQSRNWRDLILTIIGAGIIFLVSIPVLPQWPIDWVQNIPQARLERITLALTIPGIPLWIAALHWQRPEARMLLAMALSPHLPYPHDHILILFTTLRQRTIMLALSWISMLIVVKFPQYAVWSMAIPYYASLVNILLTRKEGKITDGSCRMV